MRIFVVILVCCGLWVSRILSPFFRRNGAFERRGKGMWQWGVVVLQRSVIGKYICCTGENILIEGWVVVHFKCSAQSFTVTSGACKSTCGFGLGRI